MKDRAKAFAFICFGMMCLAIGFQFGARTVWAQGGQAIAITLFGNGVAVLTDAGDIIRWDSSDDTWQFVAHYGGGVRTEDTSWGEVKAKYGND